MSGDDHFLRPDNNLANLGPHRQAAFSILAKHPDVLLDDEPLDKLIEDIASALQNAFDLGFRAAGGAIYSSNEDPSGQRREPMEPHPIDDEAPF